MELALGFAAAEPVESHIHGFGEFGDDGFVDNAAGSGVVCLKWGGWLGPAHLDEGLLQRDHFFGCDEECGFCRGHDKFDDLSYGEDRAISMGIGSFLESMMWAPALLWA